MMKITDFFKTKELHGKNQGTYILIGNLNKRKNLLPVIKFIGDRKTHLSQKRFLLQSRCAHSFLYF